MVIKKKKKIFTLTLTQTSLRGKSRRLEVGFGLFRIIFTLTKLKQKELTLNSTEFCSLFETAQKSLHRPIANKAYITLKIVVKHDIMPLSEMVAEVFNQFSSKLAIISSRRTHIFPQI